MTKESLCSAYDVADFSRDGQWMTYVAYPEDTLWRSRVDGSQKLQLTFLPMEPYLPRWSPDGKRIAFQGRTPGKPWIMHIISSDGGDLEEIRPWYGEIGSLADGNSVVFSTKPQMFDVGTGWPELVLGRPGRKR